MVADKDWKEKYYDSLQNLDDHQANWNELEELLRKAATRLAITAKGIDKRLDRVLADIQGYIRKKDDDGLKQGLEKLSRILADIDDQAAQTLAVSEDKAEAEVTDPDIRPPLRSLVGQLRVDEVGRAEFERFNEAMPNLSASECVDELAKTINGMLEVAQVLQQPDAETQPETTDNADRVREVLITLVEKIAFTQGDSEHLGTIKARLDQQFEQENWQAYLDEIISELRVIIDGVNDEKGELESLIVDITRQLSEISHVLQEERAAHQEGREQARQLQTLMDSSVEKINLSVDNASDIRELKVTINENLGAIKTGLQDFLHSDAERYSHTEARNARLLNQITALEKESEQLKLKLSEDRRKLMFDALTGARSRLAYDEILEQEFLRWRRYKEVFSFALFDIDHFKRINDQYGHNAGDKALRVVAQSLGKNLRKTDFLFRIGGEEFVLLLPKTDLGGSQPLVEKLRASIGAMAFHFKQERVVITLSAGLTTITRDDTAESIYERADKALYEAKNAGRNRLVSA